MHIRPLAPETLGLPGRRPLFLAGDLPTAPRLAVVGSRAARHDRARLASAAAAALASRSLALVSGGALGIDAAAHRGALGAGAPQLAVLPCGPDRPYPPQHVPLFREIAGAPGSGLLYCHPAGTEPARGMFVSRNAIVVGLARALLVVEAGARSGSHATGLLALRRGLPVAVVLGAPGCDALAARGAQALPPDPGRFAAGLAAWLDALAGGPAPAGPCWPPELQWLREALAAAGPRGLALDDLDAPLTRLPALLAAETLGLVVESPPGRYRRAG